MSDCVEIKDSDYIELCHGDFFRDSERFRDILSGEHSYMDTKTLVSKIRENPISDYGLEVLVGEIREKIGDLPCEIHTLKGKRFIPQLKNFDTGDKIGFFVCFESNHAHLIIKIGNRVFDLDSIAPDNVIKNIDDVDGLDIYTVLDGIQTDGYNCKSFTASLVDRFMMRVEKIKGENPEASDHEISELFFSYLSSFFQDKKEVVSGIARVEFECYIPKCMTLTYSETIRWNSPGGYENFEEIITEKRLDILPPEMAILDEHSKRLIDRIGYYRSNLLIPENECVDLQRYFEEYNEFKTVNERKLSNIAEKIREINTRRLEAELLFEEEITDDIEVFEDRKDESDIADIMLDAFDKKSRILHDRTADLHKEEERLWRKNIALVNLIRSGKMISVDRNKHLCTLLEKRKEMEDSKSVGM